MSNKAETTEKRKAQLRESQRRRREMLSANERHQVNLYLSKHVIQMLDTECANAGLDRHDFVEGLILGTLPIPPKSNTK